jgi:purine-binding chemotaxis protein CheW
MRTEPNRYLVFVVHQRLYGLTVGCVERVVLTPYITPLPDPPEGLLGVFNFQGDSIPVLNLRQRFQVEDRALTLSDPLILCHLGDRRLAIWVDEVRGVWSAEALECVEPDCVWPGLGDLCGVAHVGAEVVAVLDPSFLEKEQRRIAPEESFLERTEGE